LLISSRSTCPGSQVAELIEGDDSGGSRDETFFNRSTGYETASGHFVMLVEKAYFHFSCSFFPPRKTFHWKPHHTECAFNMLK
jgi:hypothetical protein